MNSEPPCYQLVDMFLITFQLVQTLCVRSEKELKYWIGVGNLILQAGREEYCLCTCSAVGYGR